MQVKTWLITLPFLCLAGGAMAQPAPDAAPAPAEATAAPAKAEAKDAAPAKAAKPQMRPRQGGDIRSCLDKKDNKAVIRCAEHGRKPVQKHVRKHAPAPKPEAAPAPEAKPAPAPAPKP
jgi:DnaK suppressor protein